MYTYIHFFFWISVPFRPPQSAEFPVLYSRFILLTLYIVDNVYLPIHPILPSPLGLHTFVLYICYSISALQISSSVLFSQIPCISNVLQYLLFSF